MRMTAWRLWRLTMYVRNFGLADLPSFGFMLFRLGTATNAKSFPIFSSKSSYGIFMEEADKCSPPLEDAELSMIWQSACRFAEKVKNQDGYGHLPKHPIPSMPVLCVTPRLLHPQAEGLKIPPPRPLPASC